MKILKIVSIVVIVLLSFLPTKLNTMNLQEDYLIDRREIYINKLLSNDIRNDILSIIINKTDNTWLLSIKNDIIFSINDKHLIYMEKQRNHYNIPKEIYYRQIWKESTYNPIAESHVGAFGYMQVLPSTFDWVKDYLKLDINDINDPYDNIKCGAFLMRHLKDRIDKRYPDYNEYKRWKRTLSSYNAGYGVHNIALRDYKETKDYVKFILDIFKEVS